jgi:hypothetical protein
MGVNGISLPRRPFPDADALRGVASSLTALKLKDFLPRLFLLPRARIGGNAEALNFRDPSSAGGTERGLAPMSFLDGWATKSPLRRTR